MQESRQIWSVRRLLDWSINYFKSKEIPQPKLSAELLLAHVLGCTRMQLYLNFERILDESLLAKYKANILKRSEHMPVQYILKKAHFRNLDLYVDENVLIPRPETELLVDKILQSMIEISAAAASRIAGKSGTGCRDADNTSASESLKILEIGTGSGAVAISLAQEIDGFAEKNLKTQPEWSIAASEKSESGLKIAIQNAQKLLDSRKFLKIKFFCADIVPEDDEKFLTQFKGKINMVVSNPPYICRKDYEKLPQEVRQYEPAAALLAGKTGLEIYEKIIDRVKDIVCQSCCTYIFETDPKISQQVKKLLQERLHTTEIIIEKDYNGRDRIITARASKS